MGLDANMSALELLHVIWAYDDGQIGKIAVEISENFRRRLYVLDHTEGGLQCIKHMWDSDSLRRALDDEQQPQ